MVTRTDVVVRRVQSAADPGVVLAVDVAIQDPIALLMLLVGAVLTAFSVGFVLVLTVGALFAWVRDAVST